MTSRILWAFLLGSAPALAAGAEGATAGPSGPRIGIHLGLENFNWSEQDPSQSRELLEEEGPRFAGAITLDNFLKPTEGPVYALEARGYVGEVNYDGETQTGTPLKTDVNYSGVMGEARVGYRFAPAWAQYGFDVLAGLGGEFWSRDIQDSSISQNNQVVHVDGYEEEYTLAYTKFGFGIADQTFEEWFGRLEAGLRYPLEVEEQVEAYNLELSPDPNPGFYASYELSKTIPGGQQVGVTVYYDSYRFDPSPKVPLGNRLVWQPESDMDVIGLRFGVFL